MRRLKKAFHARKSKKAYQIINGRVVLKTTVIQRSSLNPES